ncbi:hypothetical protein [uncultured Serinicoccus sp.]|nr:hypothetical protein [uncultured Serinicoccus sp.]
MGDSFVLLRGANPGLFTGALSIRGRHDGTIQVISVRRGALI